mmetsp:Transcript_15088/g.22700  ORF Transcript_15088/g.22700 Transcript_15088/m.22700 type:complete len:82 (-) Transcript_15088:56-301(-)
MRQNRTYLVLSKDKPSHELDSIIPLGVAQMTKAKKHRNIWNEIVYSSLGKCAHPKAVITAALSSQPGARLVDGVEAQAKVL